MSKEEQQRVYWHQKFVNAFLKEEIVVANATKEEWRSGFGHFGGEENGSLQNITLS